MSEGPNPLKNNLGGFARRNRPTPAPPPQPEPQPAPPKPVETHTGPDPVSSPSRGASTQADRQRINVTVYVVPELHDDLRTRSAQTGITVSDLVVRALAHVADHAVEAINADINADTAPSDAGGLFDLTPSRPVGVTKTQLGVRMTRHNKAGLDQLTTTSGARDRSHLVSVAVRDYLTCVSVKDSIPAKKKGRHAR